MSKFNIGLREKQVYVKKIKEIDCELQTCVGNDLK